MTEYYNYENFSRVKVLDCEGFKKWEDSKCKINGEHFNHLLNVFFIGNQLYCELEDELIPYFSPDDCTVQMFFSELSKYTDPFSFSVYDTQFFYEGEGAECWQIYVKSKGEIGINILELTFSRELTDVTQNIKK